MSKPVVFNLTAEIEGYKEYRVNKESRTRPCDCHAFTGYKSIFVSIIYGLVIGYLYYLNII